MNTNSNPIKIVKMLLTVVLLVATIGALIVVLSGRGIIAAEDLGFLSAMLPQQEQSEDEPQAESVSYTDAVSAGDAVVQLPTDEQPEETVPVPVPLSAEAQQALINIADSYECDIAQIAVINDGYVTNTFSFGYADISSGKLMNDDTKIRVASLSKVLVGMMAMRAQQDGYLNLDITLTKQLGYRVVNPSYSKHSLTLRDILTHTATFNDYAQISGRSLQNFLQDKGSYFFSATPKTKESWSYSNCGIRAAGGIIEVLTNQPMHTYIDKTLFDPLGIDASFFAKLIDDTDNIATLYQSGNKRSLSIQEQLSRQYYEFPGANCSVFAGGLTISAQDYGRLMCILMRDGEYDGTQYLQPEMVADMEKVRFQLDKFDQCTVIRHHSSFYDGRELYYHTGAAYGVLSFAAYDKAAQEGVVITTVGAGLQARDDVGVHNICAEMAKYLFGNVLDGQKNS